MLTVYDLLTLLSLGAMQTAQDALASARALLADGGIANNDF
ncbi:MAG: hypothetical protein OXG23_09705 [Chloroflexi bacterium]|nr:hypothetical protein [Chloroflexota bacterium]